MGPDFIWYQWPTTGKVLQAAQRIFVLCNSPRFSSGVSASIFSLKVAVWEMFINKTLFSKALSILSSCSDSFTPWWLYCMQHKEPGRQINTMGVDTGLDQALHGQAGYPCHETDSFIWQKIPKNQQQTPKPSAPSSPLALAWIWNISECPEQWHFFHLPPNLAPAPTGWAQCWSILHLLSSMPWPLWWWNHHTTVLRSLAEPKAAVLLRESLSEFSCSAQHPFQQPGCSTLQAKPHTPPKKRVSNAQPCAGPAHRGFGLPSEPWGLHSR